MTASVLVVDVGNTATSIGLFPASTNKSPRPTHVWTISTSDILKGRRVHHFLKKKISKTTIVGGMVSSVVPEVDAALKRQLKTLTGRNFSFVTGKMRSRVKVLYKNPSEVGADRIVNARAAMELTKRPSIVIDFGTATTFDCITKKGAYLGGVIAPGPVISAEALYAKTSKLPMVLLKKPVSILGRNTLESIQAGLYHGYRGLVQEIVAQLKMKMGPRTFVMATGGQAHWILKGAKGVDKFVPQLTLHGLFYLWRDTRVM